MIRDDLLLRNVTRDNAILSAIAVVTMKCWGCWNAVSSAAQGARTLGTKFYQRDCGAVLRREVLSHV